VLFTAGFKETGSAQGEALQEELAEVARRTGMRIIGPNCMGFYAPKSGLSFFPGVAKEPGPVGMVSHSGSLTNVLGRMAVQKGIRFSKVVSVGNECDLTCAEFLWYLGRDADTEIIGMYLEGVKRGRMLLDALKRTSLRKPVIVWKLGLTDTGSLAAASHTAALTGSREIWRAVVRQGGAVPVEGFESWVDSLMGFSLLQGELGNRMAILSGLGGMAVAAAEACGRAGLQLAQLAGPTRERLSQVAPSTGTSVKNPIDVGLTASMDPDIYGEAAQAAAADPGVDAVMVAGVGLSPETNRKYTDHMIQAQRQHGKPFLMVNIPGFDQGLAQEFCTAGIPFFESSDRAMETYARVLGYQRWRKRQTA
jgi:acyl-CoA synthetase (NDP forming)